MRAIADLHRVSEDDRIEIIVDAIKTGGRIGLLLEDEKLAPGKIQRYIEKVKAKISDVTITVSPGPVANVSTVVFVQGN